MANGSNNAEHDKDFKYETKLFLKKQKNKGYIF